MGSYDGIIGLKIKQQHCFVLDSNKGQGSNEFLKFFDLEFELEEMEILKNEQVILTNENIIDGDPESEVNELNYNIINKENSDLADVGINTVKPTKLVCILGYYFKVHDDGTLVYVYKRFNLPHINAGPFYDTLKL